MDRKLPVLDPSGAESRYYLRFRGDDVPGTLGKITTVLGKNGISIESVIQEGRKAGGGEVPIVMMTHDAAGRDIRKALGEIADSAVPASEAVFMKIEEI